MLNDRIIVLQKFNGLIEANIDKTKLDAYGIPCFLSEENLTALTTPLLSGGIRLHIFEQDKERVIELLAEDHLPKHEDEDLISCPKCKSKRIVINDSKRINLYKGSLKMTRNNENRAKVKGILSELSFVCGETVG